MLAPVEWDFSNIADEDLANCCHWEYAREICPDDADDDTLLDTWLAAKAAALTASEAASLNICCRLLPLESRQRGRIVSVDGNFGMANVGIESRGWVRIALQVNLKDGSQKILAAEFSDIIKKIRSIVEKESAEHALRKGPGGMKTEDLRARLHGLALMRLRHLMPVESIMTLLADHPYRRWRKSDSVHMVRSRIDAVRNKTLVWFKNAMGSGYHTLLHKLPRSWEPFSVYVPSREATKRASPESDWDWDDGSE